MQITILGTGAAFPRPGSACSGFLVRSDTTSVWLDAGNGTFSRLQEHMSFKDVDALVLSHAHADHIADVIPMMYALGYDEDECGNVPVHAPPEVSDVLQAYLHEGSRETFGQVFSFTPLADPFEVGDLRFEPFRTVHPVETYGFRISDETGLVVYTADTAMFDELPDLCRGADVLIAEATYVRPWQLPPGIHLWGDEAGQLAGKAEVRRMLLTHTWGSIPVAEAVREAAEAWDGPVEEAGEGKTYIP